MIPRKHLFTYLIMKFKNKFVVEFQKSDTIWCRNRKYPLPAGAAIIIHLEMYFQAVVQDLVPKLRHSRLL